MARWSLSQGHSPEHRVNRLFTAMMQAPMLPLWFYMGAKSARYRIYGEHKCEMTKFGSIQHAWCVLLAQHNCLITPVIVSVA